jgi:tetratricopeptide (TPR) repeat protein
VSERQATELEALIERAHTLAVAGTDPDEAERVNLQILELDMANLSAMRRLGKIAKDRGDNDAALAYYRRVLELEPADTIARNQLDRLQGGPVKSSPKAIALTAIQGTMATLLRDVELGPAAPTGPETVRWPKGTEDYPGGWQLTATSQVSRSQSVT